MKKILYVFFVLLIFALHIPTAVFAAGGNMRCSVCRKRLKERFFKSSDKRLFCSKKCFDSILPVCAWCKKVCRKGVFQSDGKTFCSKQCVLNARPRCYECKKICADGFFKQKEKYFCSKRCVERFSRPKCMRCGEPFSLGKKIPSVYGEYFYCMKCDKAAKCLCCERPTKNLRLQSNRSHLCKDCDVDVVKSHNELEKTFKSVRNLLISKLGFRFDHPVKLQMRAHGQDKKKLFIETGELGFYHYSGREVIVTPGLINLTGKKRKSTVRYEDEKCSIVVMDLLPRRKLAEVLAHELAHDYMRHRWYYINDDKVKEGFAEFVAAEYNRLTGNAAWNCRMEYSKDPVYGDGYRMVKKWHQKGKWREIYRQLDMINKRKMPPELK